MKKGGASHTVQQWETNTRPATHLEVNDYFSNNDDKMEKRDGKLYWKDGKDRKEVQFLKDNIQTNELYTDPISLSYVPLRYAYLQLISASAGKTYAYDVRGLHALITRNPDAKCPLSRKCIFRYKPEIITMFDKLFKPKPPINDQLKNLIIGVLNKTSEITKITVRFNTFTKIIVSHQSLDNTSVKYSTDIFYFSPNNRFIQIEPEKDSKRALSTNIEKTQYITRGYDLNEIAQIYNNAFVKLAKLATANEDDSFIVRIETNDGLPPSYQNTLDTISNGTIYEDLPDLPDISEFHLNEPTDAILTEQFFFKQPDASFLGGKIPVFTKTDTTVTSHGITRVIHKCGKLKQVKYKKVWMSIPDFKKTVKLGLSKK